MEQKRNVQALKVAYSKSEAETELARWKTALQTVATGQSYNMRGRSLSKVDQPLILDTIELFAAIVAAYDDSVQAKQLPQILPGRVAR